MSTNNFKISIITELNAIIAFCKEFFFLSFIEQIKGENNIVAESLSRRGELTIIDNDEIAKEKSQGEGFKNLQKSIPLKFKMYYSFWVRTCSGVFIRAISVLMYLLLSG